jgi:hypothetical protein
MIDWIKKNIKLPKFLKDLIESLSNTAGGFSLRKVIATMLALTICYLVVKHTDKDNLSSVITILCSTLTGFVVTYSVSNVQEMKLAKKPDLSKEDPVI